MRKHLTHIVAIVAVLVLTIPACNSIQEPPQDKFDTDIPESEEFDAFLGTWDSSGNNIVFIHSEPLDGSAEPGKLDQVWIYNLQTGQRRKITDGRLLAPDIHPDGEWVVSHTHSIPEFIFKVRVDGTGLTRLTGEGTPNDFENTNLARFSPNGDKILFTIVAGTPRGISLMDTTGANAEIIVPIGVMGDWFPDGERIVYVNWDTTSPADKMRQIYTANNDGSDQTKITNLDSSDLISAPDVSPNGEKITFAHRGEDNSLEIFVMDADGTNIRQLTQGEGSASAPEWHSDGTTILFSRRIFVSATETIKRLWLVDAQSREVTPVFPKE